MSITFTAWDSNLDPFVEAGDFAGLRAARPFNMTFVDCNFHNQGAVDTLRLLGLPADPGGRISSADLHGVRRSIILARNLPGRRAPFVYKPEAAGRLHMGGQVDALILYRLERLDEVVTHCMDHGWDLSWG